MVYDVFKVIRHNGKSSSYFGVLMIVINRQVRNMLIFIAINKQIQNSDTNMLSPQNSRANQTSCQLYSSTLSFSKKLAEEAQSTRETSLLDHYLRIKTEPEQRQSEDDEFYDQRQLYSAKAIYKQNDSPHLSQQSQSSELESYKNIESILKRENDNLKQQNMFLLNEVYRLRKTNKSYKTQYLHKKLEVEQCRTQCVAYKKRADELKDIIMSKLDELEEELGTLKGSQSERSILEILTLMDSSELESRASIV